MHPAAGAGAGDTATADTASRAAARLGNTLRGARAQTPAGAAQGGTFATTNGGGAGRHVRGKRRGAQGRHVRFGKEGGAGRQVRKALTAAFDLQAAHGWRGRFTNALGFAKVVISYAPPPPLRRRRRFRPCSPPPYRRPHCLRSPPPPCAPPFAAPRRPTAAPVVFAPRRPTAAPAGVCALAPLRSPRLVMPALRARLAVGSPRPCRRPAGRVRCRRVPRPRPRRWMHGRFPAAARRRWRLASPDHRPYRGGSGCRLSLVNGGGRPALASLALLPPPFPRFTHTYTHSHTRPTTHARPHTLPPYTRYIITNNVNMKC